MFTKQHYKAIAAAIRTVTIDDDTKELIVNALSDTFVDDNRLFSTHSFARACGLSLRRLDRPTRLTLSTACVGYMSGCGCPDCVNRDDADGFSAD